MEVEFVLSISKRLGRRKLGAKHFVLLQGLKEDLVQEEQIGIGC